MRDFFLSYLHLILLVKDFASLVQQVRVNPLQGRQKTLQVRVNPLQGS